MLVLEKALWSLTFVVTYEEGAMQLLLGRNAVEVKESGMTLLSVGSPVANDSA